MRTLLKAALFAGLALPAGAASAQDSDTGFYIGLNAGIANLGDTNVTYYDAPGTFGGAGTEDTLTMAFDPKSAATFGGTVGYDFGPVRADVEVAYSRNKLRSLT